MVVIRHYAPNAKGLVYFQKAVLSTLAVWNKHGEMNRVKPSNVPTVKQCLPKTRRQALEFSFSILWTHLKFFLVHPVQSFEGSITHAANRKQETSCFKSMNCRGLNSSSVSAENFMFQ